MNEPQQVETINPLTRKQINDLIYESVKLSKDELRAAILEAKKKKYFEEKHAPYWALQEKDYGL